MQWRRPELLFPAGVLVLLLLVGANLGLTDDEAYHWVLAHRPSLGYAYHPPGMAWFVALSRALLSPFPWIAANSELAVRLPAALTIAGILAIALRWISEVSGRTRVWSALGVLSFAGLFSLGWMMVPDTPLFLGWTVAFHASWKLCEDRKEWWGWGPLLALGCALAMIGKFSGVLVPASVAWVAFTLAPRERRWKILGYAALGGILAATPVIVWNAQHGWGAILYQIRDRHGESSLSLLRYGKFWAVSLVVAGPLVIAELFALLRPKLDRPHRFIRAFTLPPAAIYLLQPLWSDFKPHWAFIVWWPLAIALGLRLAHERPGWVARAQVTYAFALWAVVTVSLFDPVMARVQTVLAGTTPNPLHDVTNDLHGWSLLPAFLAERGIPTSMPVLGSRYQTSSQAAFALADGDRVSLVPRDLKARDEWSTPEATENVGPEWPRLRAPVLYVADNRYTQRPEYRDALCEVLGRIEARRGPYLAKWIDVWKCEPRPARP
jgi:4-amino-4-deoxy-L-arabinose transferase-like glycosyltransferase